MNKSADTLPLPPAELPAALGYRMPPEWAPHSGTWLSWPHNVETWPDELDRVEEVMCKCVAALAPYETVHINVRDEAHEQHVRALLSRAEAAGSVRLHRIPTNDAWVRDHGAIFVVRHDGDGRSLAATDWGFNSWGGKYPPWDDDNRVPDRMAEVLRIPRFESDIILEGGSIDVNGAGILLTTEQCLLNPNRNPHLTREEIEARLRAYLGVEKILWLGEGIVGDDTDGHVDDITRFVAEDTIVTVVEEDMEDENGPILRENLRMLQSMTTVDGKPFNIVTLPMPRPVVIKGERMPASYCNFYIANDTVILPTYRDAVNDVMAQDTLQKLFPTRRVVPIDFTDVIWGLGAIHCLTQQVPAV